MTTPAGRSSPSERAWHSLDEVEAAPSVVTIGFFDGVHRGHQAIFDRTAASAEELGLRALAVTFDRHPSEVLRPGSQPPLLMTRERRVRTLLEVGADRVLVLPFTLELSQLEPAAFVDQVLVAVLDVRKAVVGSNFRFGHRASGDVSLLADLGTAHGFDVEAVPLRSHLDRPISSSTIRQRLADGDVRWVAEALGRPHVLDGTVVRGDRRGHQLGVPTINVDVSERMAFPANGVYAGDVDIPDGRWPAVTSVGTRPTFDGETVTVESHLLDFDGDLYGAQVSVGFTHRLRDELKFDTVGDLVAAMEDDIRHARALLSIG
ncbi:MAG: bifunctional riboflavin kinase/FAD synthetase [Actinomycetota bacterium]|nr:bifunctional riboflavin kinase/FAD synthetase [Actinomycetota bacterium]